MGSLTTGGGSSAVAASAHAGSERYRHTDPLVTGRHRRELARALGHPDTTAGIPEARWVRAMTFERLVRHERFVSRLLTTAVGQLGLERPVAVLRADGGASPDTTAEKLAVAHERAVADGAATMVTGLAVPFVGLEHHPDATPVKPDFAIVARRRARTGGGPQAGDPGPVVGSWLIVGDAKDYERVRSRIDDQRMLKGFLQVALGAESAEAWSRRPEGMEVHRWGVLAVPRNAFLQPEAVVELLDDHRQEVRARAEERRQLLERGGGIGGDLGGARRRHPPGVGRRQPPGDDDGPTGVDRPSPGRPGGAAGVDQRRAGQVGRGGPRRPRHRLPAGPADRGGRAVVVHRLRRAAGAGHPHPDHGPAGRGDRGGPARRPGGVDLHRDARRPDR